MAKYSCSDCGMETNNITCGKCGSYLEHKTLTKDDGSQVAISECPKGLWTYKVTYVSWS